MPGFKLDRRTMLKGMLGAGVVSIGLPALEIFYDPPYSARASACSASTFPKRLGVWFWGNGVIPSQWVPTTEGEAYDLPPLLVPLAALRSKLTVVSGLDVKTPNTDPHGSGPAGLFAGGNLTPQTDGVARTGTFPGPSFDQIVARGIEEPMRFPSLHVGVQRSSGSLSFNRPNSSNTTEFEPHTLFANVFGGDFRLPGEGGGVDPTFAMRRSVLDVVSGHANRLSRRLGAADRARLDQHLTGIRDLETSILRLEAGPPNYAGCMRPEEPELEYPDVEGRPQMSAVNRVISDIVAMALACDQTRVFTVMYTQPVNNTLFGTHSAGHHHLTHDEPDPQTEVLDILTSSIMSDLAYFLGRLDQVEEGDETLLDHCAVLCTTDVALGRTHELTDYPLLVAGCCNDELVTGRHIRAAGDNATKLTLTLIRAMLGDSAAPTFGMGAGMVSDGVSGLGR